MHIIFENARVFTWPYFEQCFLLSPDPWRDERDDWNALGDILLDSEEVSLYCSLLWC
jgi:hypothetical protein